MLQRQFTDYSRQNVYNQANGGTTAMHYTKIYYKYLQFVCIIIIIYLYVRNIICA